MMNFFKFILITFSICFYLPLQALQFFNGKDSVKNVENRFPAFGKITNVTGTLIDSSWVLTCEHCEGHKGAELEINGQKHKVDKRIPHPLRSRLKGVADVFDLALLHLETPVTNLKPIRRYRGTLDALVGKIGWLLGKNSQQGRLSSNFEAGTCVLGLDLDYGDVLTRNPDHTAYESVQTYQESGSAVFMNIQDPMSQDPPQNESDFYKDFALIGIYTGGYPQNPRITPLCRPEVNNWIDNTITAYALGQKEEAGRWVISLSKPKLEDAPSGLLGVATDAANSKSIVALIDSSWLLVSNGGPYGTVFEKDATIELDHQSYKIQRVEFIQYAKCSFPITDIRLVQLDRPYLGAKPIKRPRVTGEEYQKGYPLFYWNEQGQLQKAYEANRDISITKGRGVRGTFHGPKTIIMSRSWVLSETNKEFLLAGINIPHVDNISGEFFVVLLTKQYNTWIDNTIKYALQSNL